MLKFVLEQNCCCNYAGCRSDDENNPFHTNKMECITEICNGFLIKLVNLRTIGEVLENSCLATEIVLLFFLQQR